jgi:hypothetical protein
MTQNYKGLIPADEKVANTHWLTRAEQEAYWKRKDDEYEAYLSELHARQQDPDYIKSYQEWLDDAAQPQLAIEEMVRRKCEEGDPRFD